MHDRKDTNIEMPATQLLAWPALTFALSWTLFPALKLELENNLVFPVAFSQVVLVFLAGALVLTCLTLLLCRICNARWRKVAALTLMSLASIAWIKSCIFAWDHTIFDGKSVNWNIHRFENLADLALCLSIAGFAAFKREWLILNRNGVCAFILLAQILYLAWMSPLISDESFGELLAKETVSIKPKTTEILSRRKNLIVIVLDTFQSDIFSELIDARPTIASGLTGFTFFHNTASVYPYTEVSVPSVLTGVDYENQKPYNRYLYQSYLGPTSILARLMQEGYYVEVDRWGTATPIPYLSSLASNFVPDRIPPMSTVEDMALVSLYSVLPGFGKRIIYQHVSETLIDVQGTRDNNMGFVRDLSKLGVELIDRPVAKIIHLKGPHVPLRRYERYGFDYFAAASDPDATFTEVETSRENYKAVAMQSLLAVHAYVDKLKQAQAYDNATIFVFGDHGAGLQGQHFVLPTGWPVKSPQDVIAGDLPTAAIPLLLVKRAAAGGSMVTSAVPASLDDVNCTVFRELDLAQSAPCMSLFDSDIASRPARRFLWPDVATFSDGYLREMKEFQIKGPVWAESSWTQSGRRFAAGGFVRTTRATYNLGEAIRFGSRGNAAAYQSYGWGEAGHGFTWTIGKRSTMAIPLPSSNPGPLILEATLSPLVVGGKLDRQLIGVYANGEKVGEWVAAENGQYKAAIPARLSASGLIELRFDLPDATSLAQLGVNDDRAVLGLQMESIALHEVDPPEP
jgi:Sulfatase